MSRTHVLPIHVAEVGSGHLRFFASPLDGPRLPWFATSDLFTCLSLPRGARRVLYASTKRRWADDVRLVWTETGETMIAPHWMARTLIDALADAAGPSPKLEGAYAKAAAGALSAITSGLPVKDRLAYSLAAFRSEIGLEEASA